MSYYSTVSPIVLDHLFEAFYSKFYLLVNDIIFTFIEILM